MPSLRKLLSDLPFAVNVKVHHTRDEVYPYSIVYPNFYIMAKCIYIANAALLQTKQYAIRPILSHNKKHYSSKLKDKIA